LDRFTENAETRSYFDSIASSWDNREDELELRRRLVAMMGIEKNSLIADIGCGKGVMFEALLETHPRGIIAVDISGEMVSHAKTLYQDERLMYINGDVLGAFLPVFDCAVMFNSYPHFKDKKALAEKLARHVRPGGRLVIAHSRGRERINGVHEKGMVCELSAPLRPAEEEAAEFLPHFRLEGCVDSAELYFINMSRLKE
jgi:ubiquinone/menaquinone biosynthesis C-methylase UbiE